MASSLVAAGITGAAPARAAAANETDLRGEVDFMRGFPPAPEARVNETNWQSWPQAKWSVRHMREVFSSRDATPAEMAPLHLPEAPRAFDGVQVQTADGALSWEAFLAATHTDAALVMVNGRIVYERYFDGMRPSDPHILFSAGKSYCGFLAEIMAARGQLDFAKRIEFYVPELAQSAFAGASMRQIADMTDGVRFEENYTDASSDAFRYLAAMGLGPRDSANPPIGAYAAMRQITAREHPPGHGFQYRSVVTDALGWALQRIAGKSLSALYAEEIHGPAGCADQAYYTLDATGQEVAAGGINMTLRDFARFGEMLRRQGRVGARQAFPAAAVASVFAGGDRDAFARGGQTTRPGWSYKSQFWHTHDHRNAVWLLGVRGQRMVIAPELNLVMAKFGSHPVLSNAATDAIHGAALNALERAFG